MIVAFKSKAQPEPARTAVERPVVSSSQRERSFPMERQLQSIGNPAPVEKRVLRQSTQKRRFTVKREQKIKGSTCYSN